MSTRLHFDPTRTTAIGMARYAHEFLEAAFAVDTHMGAKPGFEIMAPVPALYLVGHGCELTLKAFLLHKGATLQDIKKLGHDLSAALAEARSVDLDALVTFQDGEDGAFELLNDLYSTKQLEYIVTGAKTVPMWGLLERAAVRMFNPVSAEVGYRKQFEGYSFLE
ncbi:hypothetical protein M0765_022190 [Variovorax sp. S2]|uniref:hypothetical protein n=1 Tax=Variovorax sp. S12S4 TaxID=3029170 RepID=UPI00215D4DA8|nr:hypothetical protein [Variovorax sp. S12S4]MCR8960338.1 hypothetical protein [Variovorax sp. S12S4]